MRENKHIVFIFAFLNFFQGVSCQADSDITGLVVASTITGVLLCLVIVMAVMFAFWKESYKRSQLRRGRIKVPRSWLDFERKAKIARKQRIKQQIKEQLSNQEKAKQHGGVDMEMQYMHRSRPQIPGSWRREIRNQNGYIVKEVPTLQRTVLVENQPVMVEVSQQDDAIWTPGGHIPTEIRYSQLTNPSTAVPVSLRSDKESRSSSVSEHSTLRAGDKKKDKMTIDYEDEVIEASIDFSHDPILGDDQELQERATAF